MFNKGYAFHGGKISNGTTFQSNLMHSQSFANLKGSHPGTGLWKKKKPASVVCWNLKGRKKTEKRISVAYYPRKLAIILRNWMMNTERWMLIARGCVQFKGGTNSVRGLGLPNKRTSSVTPWDYCPPLEFYKAKYWEKYYALWRNCSWGKVVGV